MDKKIVNKQRPDWSHESLCQGNVAGIDEVGRGPWAGPVVAASLVFHQRDLPSSLMLHIHDSKKLTHKKRVEIYDILTQSDFCSYGIGQASVEEIDQINIRQATFLAMQRSLSNLNTPVHMALVDGNALPKLPCPAKAIISGDQFSLSIAAASIIAKVFRDQMMVELSEQFPGYGWETNMGYGTKQHQDGLKIHGVNCHHRRSFAPIHEILKAA